MFFNHKILYFFIFHQFVIHCRRLSCWNMLYVSNKLAIHDSQVTPCKLSSWMSLSLLILASKKKNGKWRIWWFFMAVLWGNKLSQSAVDARNKILIFLRTNTLRSNVKWVINFFYPSVEQFLCVKSKHISWLDGCLP